MQHAHTPPRSRAGAARTYEKRNDKPAQAERCGAHAPLSRRVGPWRPPRARARIPVIDGSSLNGSWTHHPPTPDSDVDVAPSRLDRRRFAIEESDREVLGTCSPGGASASRTSSGVAHMAPSVARGGARSSRQPLLNWRYRAAMLRARSCVFARGCRVRTALREINNGVSICGTSP